MTPQEPRPPIAPPSLGGSAGPPMFEPGTYGDLSDAGLTVTDSVEKKPSWLMRGAMVVVALAVAGAGIFAVTRSLEAPAGAASPHEAVTSMMEALEAGDVIGIGETMLPSERESLVEPTLALLAELQRLEILDPAMDPGAMEGLDYDFEGVETTSQVLAPGIARVTLTGGTVTMRADASELPFGRIVRERMGDLIDEFEPETETLPLDTDDAEFVAVEHDGSWFVSLTYSIAENARLAAGADVPDFAASPAPVGGASPEASVEIFINELVELDLEGMLTQLDPDEFAALYDYSSLFLPDAQREINGFLDDVRSEGVTWQVDAVSTRQTESNGRTLVALEGFAASAMFDGERFAIEFADGCVTVDFASDVESVCNDGTDEVADLAPGLSDLGSDVETGLTMVERDGRWYFSMVPSLMYTYVDVLATLESSDVEDLLDEFEGLAGDFEELAVGFDPFGAGDPFTNDPFTDDPFTDDPFLDTDPLTESDPFLDPDLPDPLAEDVLLYPEELGLAISTGAEWKDPTFGEAPLVGATSGDDGVGNWVDILRYEKGAEAIVLAALEDTEFGIYEPAEYAAAPAGARVFTDSIQFYILIDNVLVVGWDDEPTRAHLDVILPYLGELQGAGQLP